MGTVYEVYQESMHRTVALKVLDSEVFPTTEETARFEREAWIGGRLSHPNIVKVYGQGVVGRIRYIAMELIEGESLAAEVQRARQERQQLPPSGSGRRSAYIREIVSLFVGVADALQQVHERGIVHRDIKPQNLLLTKDRSRLLLTDFGLARDEETPGLTRRGNLMGTIRYMSPEQMLAQHVKVDHRSDIWSLGVSLYEALTLDLPYAGDSNEAYIAAVSMKEPLPARARNRAVTRDLETILMKCLERDPGRRYASVADLKRDLLCFLEDRPVLARRPGVLAMTARLAKRHRVPLCAAALTVLLALGVVGTL
jgi:eukaryotic-like serine/threonine-protein kinase